MRHTDNWKKCFEIKYKRNHVIFGIDIGLNRWMCDTGLQQTIEKPCMHFIESNLHFRFKLLLHNKVWRSNANRMTQKQWNLITNSIQMWKWCARKFNKIEMCLAAATVVGWQSIASILNQFRIRYAFRLPQFFLMLPFGFIRSAV